MAEEFQAAVYGGNWWMSPRTAFNHSSCSSVTPDRDNHGPFWSKNLMNMKSKSSDESSDGSMVFQDAQNPTTMLPDSAFQMMVAVVSDDSAATATIDWNQNLLSAQEGMINTYSTIGDDDGSAAEIEAEHQQSLNFTTSSTSSIPYGYPLSLVQSLFINNYSPPYPPPPSHQPPFHDYQSNSNNLSYTDNLTNNTVFKRPRLETPSPLPTFKVRKEKLGDRITALQQLVSPFGKTDTASVLHEAIEYIKLLHDQVNILSASYIKGATNQLIHDKVKDVERHIQDLRSQGLCLVPVSDMFPVATDGFWTQTYEGSFK